MAKAQTVAAEDKRAEDNKSNTVNFCLVFRVFWREICFQNKRPRLFFHREREIESVFSAFF